ncbi:MAG TPA: right-handed parallel beta-helix repeat-containing protein [Bryobacteraceae bacterium]|nr:right-handed parallel beta-helix repeat-containing protein [Bryobacteraceae bacterium]
MTVGKAASAFFLFVLAGVWTVPLSAAGEQAWAVPTFESLGLYYNRPIAKDPCRAWYRVAGTQEWREGQALVYDEREKQYRGSLVGLTANTPYEIRLEADGQKIEFETRTRSETFPVGKTTYLPGDGTDQTLYIRDGGTADAWHVVTPRPGTKFVSDVFNLSDYNVVVEADYVILRGLELKNAGMHGVLIRAGVQHVVVEDCHITGWGRLGGARVWGVLFGSDSAVYAEADAGHLVIQRNLLEYPRGGANDWESGHPSGPQAITLTDSRGGNVIRYNTIRSTDDHGFNDGIGGSSNFSFKGSPNRDSDIYGNVISNCWDDAIESEGANMNVRIWSNYIHHTFVHIATAATSMGPLYIFRNVFGESRISHQDSSGGMMIKTGMNYLNIAGERVSTGLGYRFIYHNTALQPNGGLDVFSSHELHNAVSRNNIFYARGRAYPADRGEPRNDFQNDLTGSYLGGGIVRSMFLPSEGLEWYPAPTASRIQWGRVEYTRNGRNFAITDPLVQAKNPALDGGVRLPGFNDEFQGAAPDIGAFEAGLPPLHFGREMAPGFTRPPWELY